MSTPNSFRIRPAARDDLPALAAIINHYIACSAANFKLDPLGDDDAATWFRQFENPAPAARWRIVVAEPAETARFDRDFPIAGFACTTRFHERAAYETSVMSSVYLAPERSGAGLGAELYRALFRSIADADIRRVFAGITLPNPASVALHKRFGFREVGTFTEAGRKFGAYHDVLWLELPFPPRGLADTGGSVQGPRPD